MASAHVVLSRKDTQTYCVCCSFNKVRSDGRVRHWRHGQRKISKTIFLHFFFATAVGKCFSNENKQKLIRISWECDLSEEYFEVGDVQEAMGAMILIRNLLAL